MLLGRRSFVVTLLCTVVRFALQLFAVACTDGLKYWEKDNSDDDSTTPQPMFWRPPYHRARSVNVEMTAYALLTYTHRRDFSEAVPIAKWLVSQRNSRGGFTSTQVNEDTARRVLLRTGGGDEPGSVENGGLENDEILPNSGAGKTTGPNENLGQTR